MNKSNKRRDAGQTGDYTVGQVSGSLFPEKPKPGALSSLFSTSSSASTLVFVPAPKFSPHTDPKATPAKSKLTIKSKQQIPKQNKPLSAAEQKVQDRERGLQTADDEGQEMKKVKRKRLEADDAADEMERPMKRKKNIAEERIKLKRTVFVGNLPSSCSKKDLLSLFREVGAVESVRFRSVFREDLTMSRKLAAIQRKVHPKKPNINAYVLFKEEAAAAGALRWNGWQIQKGFHIRVDRVSQHQSHDHKRSIFVGNLPYDIMEFPIREHFEDCGSVEAVRLVRDKDLGIGKGFGYVLFESPDSVMLALKLDGSTLLGRKIRVKRSVKKEKVQKVAARRHSEERTAARSDKGATGRGKRPGVGGFKGSFKGEMADPAAKKNKGQKKKLKSKKKNASYI